MALLILFYKNSSSQNSEWNSEILKNGVESALNKFCRQIPVSPSKVLRTAFSIRGLSSTYISRVFIRTEMVLKSRNVLNSGTRQLARSRSSENLPTSQSQVNIQMMSHTLTIREVFIVSHCFIYFYSPLLYNTCLLLIGMISLSQYLVAGLWINLSNTRNNQLSILTVLNKNKRSKYQIYIYQIIIFFNLTHNFKIN